MILPDKKLEQRISKFNKSEISNHFSLRQNFSLRLRKDKLETKIMEKRIHSISNNEYQVNIDLLLLPDNYEEEFNKKENKLLTILETLSEENKNINIIKFCLYYLREITSEIEKETASLYEDNLLNIFYFATNLFFNSNDKQIKYESSWVLINLTYFSNNCIMELLKEEYLTNLIYIMESSEEIPILNHIVYIFSNIFSERSESDIRLHILTKHKKFLIRLKELFKNESYSLGFKKTLTWCISSFLKALETVNFNDFEEIIHNLVNNLKICVNLDIVGEEELIFETLHCIIQLNDENNECIEKFLKEGLLSVLLKIYNNNRISLRIKKKCIRTLLYLCEGSEEQLNTILDSNIMQYVYNELYNCFSKLKILNDEDMNYLIDLLNIICVLVGEYQQICDKFFKGKIVELIKVITQNVSNTHVKYEAIKIFTYAARIGSRKIWMILIQNKIIHLPLSCLKCYDNDLIYASLECMKEFLTFATKLNILNNIIKLDIENDENFDIFSKLEKSENQDISKAVKQLLSTFWKNDEMNLDFK